jgi:pyruvate carboxylase subunit B
MKEIKFMDTSFRDGFQSVFGARVLTSDFIPAVEAAAEAGITHFEAGGGARFQSLFLYCGESAFDMMDSFRKAAGPDANLQTLARGINVVALSQQPRDMIDLHAKMFKKHGITHIRNFDALNDMRNLEYSGKCIKDAGLHHQVSVTMMELPPGCEGAHDADYYAGVLKDILERGIPFDSIVFKDASGTSNPTKVYDTFAKARKLVGDKETIWYHTHATAGCSVMQTMAAIRGGADGICVARAPLSGGTSQPDLMSIWHVLKGTEYYIDIDINKILKANAVARECFKDYFFPAEAQKISSEVILSPMPGGALTANTMMMRDTGTLHLYPQVIEAMSECVRRGGFGTSVTPVSQFYFQQAFANVTQGAWKKITDGYGNMVLGYFGRTPVPPDPEIVEIAEKQMGKPRFDGDPLDVLDPGIPKAKKILEDEGLPVTDENIFIVGALQTKGGNKGLDFLKGNYEVRVRKTTKEEKEKEAEAAKDTGHQHDQAPQISSSGKYKVTVDGQTFDVQIEADSSEVKEVKPAAQQAPGGGTPVKAKVPGNVINVPVKVGDKVKQGDTVVVLEAMKMETNVASPQDGTVASIEVSKGQVVKAGDPLVTLA